MPKKKKKEFKDRIVHKLYHQTNMKFSVCVKKNEKL